MNAGFRALKRPVRTVLRWQLISTAALTLIAWLVAGAHGALFALQHIDPRQLKRIYFRPLSEGGR